MFTAGVTLLVHIDTYTYTSTHKHTITLTQAQVSCKSVEGPFERLGNKRKAYLLELKVFRNFCLCVGLLSK